MTNCKWMDSETEICCNAECFMCCDFCPVVDYPGVCRFYDWNRRGSQEED